MKTFISPSVWSANVIPFFVLKILLMHYKQLYAK